MENIFQYNGNDITLKKENDNVYVNITEVAKSFPEKNLTQIMQSSEIQEYIKTLSELYNYSSADLVRVTRGGDVLEAIRNMELAWVKVTESNFGLSEYKDPTGRILPC